MVLKVTWHKKVSYNAIKKHYLLYKLHCDIIYGHIQYMPYVYNYFKYALIEIVLFIQNWIKLFHT